jgi:hypothetical protein
MDDNEQSDQQSVNADMKHAGGMLDKLIGFIISPAGWITVGLISVLVFMVALGAVLMLMFSSSDNSCSTETQSNVTTTIDTNGNAKTIFDHLVNSNGFSGAGAAGALAVAKRESGFNPKAMNAGGGVAGIFQWSGWSNNVNGSRITSEGSIKAGDESTLTLDNQLKLVDHELNGGYNKAKTTVGNASDPVKAAHDWSEYYEGVALSDGQTKLPELDADAAQLYQQLGGSNIQANPSLIGASGTASQGTLQQSAQEANDCEGYDDSGSGADGYGLPIKGEYTLGTGTYPSYTLGSTQHDHNGVDFQNKGLSESDVTDGTDKAGVYAVHNGTVSAVQHIGDEWLVIIKGTDNKFTYYGHAMVQPPVKQGQVVKRGQLISHQGYGGDVRPKSLQAAHVHFGISSNGIGFGPNAGGIESPADYLPLPSVVTPDGKTGGANDRVTGSGFVTVFRAADTDKE